MSINICKVDPNISFVYPINFEECAGDSFETIHLNFKSLDIALSNLSFSAENIWNPIFKQTEESQATLLDVLDMVSDMSGNWNASFLIANEFSGAFLTPMSITYPEVFPEQSWSSDDTEKVTEWLNNQFPVFIGECRNYIEGQKLRMFVLRYGSVTQRPEECDWNYIKLKYNFTDHRIPGDFNRQGHVHPRNWMYICKDKNDCVVEHNNSDQLRKVSGSGTRRNVQGADIRDMEVEEIDLVATDTFRDQFVQGVRIMEYCVVGSSWVYQGILHTGLSESSPNLTFPPE